MAIQDHDWVSIIIAEIFAWTIVYWWGGGRFGLLKDAVSGTALLNYPGATPHGSPGTTSSAQGGPGGVVTGGNEQATTPGAVVSPLSP